MRNLSRKQAAKNRLLSKIKQELMAYCGNKCVICKRYVVYPDLMHLLPRSLYPEYETERWNLALGCRECHNAYDNSAYERRKSGLYDRVAAHDKQAADKYFRMNE